MSEIVDQHFNLFVDDGGLVPKLVDYEPQYVIAGDTDSVYLDISGVFAENADLDEVCVFADNLGNEVNNEFFPPYLQQLFNVPHDRCNIIETKREAVSDISLFLAKKNYIMRVLDIEGIRKTKMKYVGVAIRKSDVPIMVQDFLSALVDLIFINVSYKELVEFIDEFKHQFMQADIHSIAVPTTIRNITKSEDKYIDTESFAGIDYRGKASLIYNSLCGVDDRLIRSGYKIKIANVKHPDFKKIAFPSDIETYPAFLEHMEIDYHQHWLWVKKKIDAYLLPAKLDRVSRQSCVTHKLVSF